MQKLIISKADSLLSGNIINHQEICTQEESQDVTNITPISTFLEIVIFADCLQQSQIDTRNKDSND